MHRNKILQARDTNVPSAPNGPAKDHYEHKQPRQSDLVRCKVEQPHNCGSNVNRQNHHKETRHQHHKSSTHMHKSSKMDHRHRSSDPKDNVNAASDQYDKENIGFHVLSPQPHREHYMPRIQRPKDMNKKTLILDLDETLVHSAKRLPDGRPPCSDPDIVLSVSFEGQNEEIFVKIRPGAIDFLRKITKFYEVAVFTASVANYADKLIDILDVSKYGFYKFFREHCTYDNNYVKDLSKLGRDLKDCVMVDNLPI
jgi:Dullard-like phosphatase family protein